MKILIKGTNLELTPAVRQFIEEKIGEVAKYISDPGATDEARVEVSRTTYHHQTGDLYRAEVNLRLPGGLLRAEASRGDINTAINEVKDELQREIKKYKDSQISKRRRGERMWKRLKNYSPLAWGRQRFFKGRRDLDV